MPSPSDSTSLYRRHRPGSFDEVVGQEHVVRTLRNAVEQDKVHHAYLFVGSRGTGKTSMAKILARSLNCERGGPTVAPCGECESCQTIAAGTSVDVIEMDAASNRSVDDVRELRERVAYAPAGGRWKVYILDEAHMLTKEAWNAFLKTLEEPPPNTVFVLATTEAHRVMATIADRCQRFDFQRPSLEQISEVLRRVSAAESIEIGEDAVTTLARAASGSFRDALGTLDQLVAYGGATVRLDDVLRLLGAADAELLFAAVDAVIAEDPRAALLGVEEMARSGRDPAQFARDLLAHLRFLLVTQTVGEVPSTFVVTATDEGRLTAQAEAVGAATLVRTIDELAAALTAVREGDDARMAVEIALLKAARPELDAGAEGLVRRVERLERATEGSGPRVLSPRRGDAAGEDAPDPPAATPPAAEAAPPGAGESSEPALSGPAQAAERDESAAEAEPGSAAAANAPAAGGGGEDSEAARRPVPSASEEPSDDSEASPPTGPAARSAPAPQGTPAVRSAPGAHLDLNELTRIWPAVIEGLHAKAPALAATLDGARPVAFDPTERTITVGFPGAYTFNKRKAETPEKRELLAAAMETVFGERPRLTYAVLEDGEAEAEAQGREAREPSPPPPPAEDSDAAAPAPPDPPPGDAAGHDELVQRLKSEFDAEEVG